jgi:hypothetical protein
MDNASTRAFGSASVIRRVASIPFKSGMATSMMTTSGASSLASLTDDRPFSASPTIWMSLSCSSSVRRPWRRIL